MTLKEMIEKWKSQARAASDAHFDAARHAEQLNRFLGILVALLSALVGCGILFQLNASPSYPIKVMGVLISVLAAVLAAAHTLSNASRRSAEHISSGNEFENICKMCELELCSNSLSQNDADKIRGLFDNAHKTAAILPARFAKKVLAANGANDSFKPNPLRGSA